MAALNEIGRQTLHGYDPNEPRDWHGRWTTGGGAGARAYGNFAPASMGLLGAWRVLLDRDPSGSGAANHLYGGRLYRIQNGRGIGDNQPPESEPIPETEPFTQTPRVPPGWDTPGPTVGGLQHPPTRKPMVADGTPWIVAGHNQVKAILALQHRVTPSMVVYAPIDGLGPLIVGSTNTADFPMPSGYDAITLVGTPQVTFSGGVETGHAADSIDEALRLAASNQFSTIFFNRSFSTVTEGMVQSRIRPDVVGVARPPLNVPFKYHPYESFSNGQTQEKRQEQMPKNATIAKIYGNRYDKK